MVPAKFLLCSLRKIVEHTHASTFGLRALQHYCCMVCLRWHGERALHQWRSLKKCVFARDAASRACDYINLLYFFVAELCNVSSGWVGGSGSFHGLWLKHATYGKVQWNMWWQCHCFSNICRLKHATFQGAAECGGSAAASPTLFAGSSMQERSVVAVPLLLQRCLQSQACSIPRCSGMQWQYRSFPNVRSNFVCSALTPVMPRDNGR